MNCCRAVVMPLVLKVPFSCCCRLLLACDCASILSFRLDTDGEWMGLGESESPESSELADERQSSIDEESFSRWPCRSSCSRRATSLISSCIRFSGSSVSTLICLILSVRVRSESW
uniref:(northern house mosquito) hypothetical protein n=1 Tax=Culex pipiens TaxID=7175 RepID=A0A8D8F8U0_CULPI